MALVYTSVALFLTLAASSCAQILATQSLLSNDWEYEGTTDISVDARFQFPVSDKLYGIFFEEVRALSGMQTMILARKGDTEPPPNTDAAVLSP